MGNDDIRDALAEFAFRSAFGTTTPKLHEGAWLFAPNQTEADSYQHRHAVFVLPTLFTSDDELNAAIATKEGERRFQSLAAFLTQSAVAVVVSGAIAPVANPSPTQLVWHNFYFVHEKLVHAAGKLPFSNRPNGSAPPAASTHWTSESRIRFGNLSAERITELTLRQAFYSSYLSQSSRSAAVAGPVYISNFVVGYRYSVVPLKVTETNATARGAFGLNLERTFPLLHFGLASDANIMHIVREVDDTAARAFRAWRFITLADLIMGSSWNLQAGGAGMGGGATQTVMIGGALFGTLTPDDFTEEAISRRAGLSAAVRARASEFATALNTFVRVS